MRNRDSEGPRAHDEAGGDPAPGELEVLRTQLEHAREQERRLSTIIESTTDAVVTVDESLCVVVFNASAEAIFGVSAADAIGQPLDRFLPVAARAGHNEHVRAFGASAISRRRVVAHGPLNGVRADGTEFPIETSISHAQVGGRRLYTAIVRDVSERNRLEAQLLQTQKMESVGRLAGGVAHDFNNILTVIAGCAAELQADVSTEGGAALIGEIHEAVDRASSLTRQLLAFSQQQVVAPRSVSVSTVVRDAQRMLERLLGEDVALRVRLEPEAHLIKADPGYLTQVLLNLAVNARDAMPEGGQLEIATQNVELDGAACAHHPSAAPGPFVLLAIKDNGSGMSPEVRARAFEPFYSTKGVGKGSGLGLSVTHGIVEQCGGHIELSSEVGVGTTVSIFLPAIREYLPAHSSSRRSVTPASQRPTILLVEDDDSVRRVAVRILRGAGYEVLEASNGEQAIARFDEHASKIAMLVTDVVMPEMDGRRLAEALRKKRAALKVLYLSGYTDDAVMRYGISHEEVAFLQKPFSPAALQSRVREVLESR